MLRFLGQSHLERHRRRLRGCPAIGPATFREALNVAARTAELRCQGS